jgi:hypothetical protein
MVLSTFLRSSGDRRPPRLGGARKRSGEVFMGYAEAEIADLRARKIIG